MAHARSRAEGPSNTHHSQQKKEGEKRQSNAPGRTKGERGEINTLLKRYISTNQNNSTTLPSFY